MEVNKDGVSSGGELRKAFKTMRLIEAHFVMDVATSPERLTQLYNSIFEKFDVDDSGTANKAESEMKKILVAIADGLCSFPIQVVIQDDDQSFLERAADLEASKINQAPTS